MTYTIELSTLSYILLVVFILAGGAYCVWQWRRARRLEQFIASENEREYLPDEQLPAVSVLVYAHNDADFLGRMLPLLLHQEYPNYEVIVTDDASSDMTKNLLSDMLMHYDNLRTTFVPEGSRSLSRKKLSIMLGIKAAKNDVIVTVNANCRVMSEHWLRLIARNFVHGVDVVLGYSHYRYRRDRKLGRFYRIFDTVSTGAQYMLSAIAGTPYRGTSDNLAYRKHVFFDNTGFSRSLDLRWGDDDVYVSEIAHSGNTRVELLPDSVVTAYYDNVAYAHHALKLRRDFTSRFVSTRKPFVVQGLMSCLLYAAHLAAAAAVALNWRNVVVISVVAVLLIVMWVMMSVAVKRQCRALDSPTLAFSVPFHALWRPWVNLLYRIRGARSRRSNYTGIVD